MNDVLKLPQTLAHEPATAGAIGKVASPPRHESTSEEFYFWVAPDTLVEKSQIVRTECRIGDKDVTFYGLIREVYRQSRQSNLGEEFDRHDGDINYQPPFDSPGFTYAAVTILRTEPPVMTPPKEGNAVFLGGEHEAYMAYGADEIEIPLAVGLVKNGGTKLDVGPGRIDLDYLLGANGGHLNVNGVAGRGTKSSLLLHFNYLLLREARRQQRERPCGQRLKIVPIILNVKNFDLFHIDQRSKRFDGVKDATDWRALGIDDPAPFQNVTFYAPQKIGQEVPIETDRDKWKADVKPYSWSLKDVIERGLLLYLFAETDSQDSNFRALVHDLEGWLTDERTERDGQQVRTLIRERPQTFDDLLNQIRTWTGGKNGSCPFGSNQHYTSTISKLSRRLSLALSEGQGVIRRKERQGKPLVITDRDTCDPKVIDLSSLAAVPSLQRFVAAAIFDQLKAERTGRNVQSGLVYLVTLDELNRFAPRGSDDPVTKLIELVAAEMRSQGIILLGAQQQASLVSQRVIENAGIRALGKSGSLELSQPVWRFLSESARRKASTLLQTEKLLIQDSFREPMLVKIPFPPWALREAEADYLVTTAGNKAELEDL